MRQYTKHGLGLVAICTVAMTACGGVADEGTAPDYGPDELAGAGDAVKTDTQGGSEDGFEDKADPPFSIISFNNSGGDVSFVAPADQVCFLGQVTGNFDDFGRSRVFLQSNGWKAQG